jgi:uncharacterized membrane protein YtjA (UPF0391 family)
MARPFAAVPRGLPRMSSRWDRKLRGRSHTAARSQSMLYYAVVFLVVAVIAGILGFWALAATAAWIAKILFVVFLVLALVSFLRRA